MSWKAYEVAPIDLGWEFLPTVEEIGSKIAKSEAEAEVKGHASGPYNYATFMKHFDEAKDAASNIGWYGDYKKYAMPRVLFFPDETEFGYGFVWKQDNNGMTYVISRYALPWL